MIEFAQVVGAVALGALLAVSMTLVFQLRGGPRLAQEPARIEAGSATVRAVAAAALIESEAAEAEWKIEAARSLALETVETFRRQAASGTGTRAAGLDADAGVSGRPVRRARSKGHLTLVTGGGRIAAKRILPGIPAQPRRTAPTPERPGARRR